MPGAIANQNAVRHGLRAANLPPGCTYIEGQVRAFRRYVVDELKAANGGEPLTTYQEAVLQSAMRHEVRASLASRWLRIEGEKLALNERLALTAAIASASDARDKCLQRLGLDNRETPYEAMLKAANQPFTMDAADTTPDAPSTPAIASAPPAHTTTTPTTETQETQP